jgi:signal transduction histidine kinase
MDAVPMPPSRWWPPGGLAADRLIAVVIAVFSGLEASATGFGDSNPAVMTLVVVMGGTLAWRRTQPLAAVAAGMGAYSLLTVVDVATDDLTVVTAAILLLVYSVAMWERLRPAIAGIAIAAVAVGVVIFAAGRGPGDYLWAAMLLGGTWGLGRAMRGRLLQVAQLTEIATRARLEREHEAAAAVAGERNRIARELHDIVSHGLSVMVVQAAAAESAVEDAPGEAIRSLRSIQDVGREAQAEMVRMLGLMRDGRDGQSLSPVPGVADVGSLVERMRAAGLPIDFTVDGEAQPLPGSVGLTAYRVVQEALTNVRRHAGAVETSVGLTYLPGSLRVAIWNAPGATPGPTGGGHGLMGMRERVAACGGRLSVTPGQDGSFEIVAALPLEGA